MLSLVFGLLLAFQIKHFVADYPLQTEWMLGKFKPTGWTLPLAAHCAVHAAFTCLIALFFTKWALLLGLLDGTIHFVMDRIKADPKLLGRFKPLTAETYPKATDSDKRGNKLFWWALGFDQMIHHLTDYLIIALLVFK